MIKNKVYNSISGLILASGYFVYDYVLNVNANYSIIAMLLILSISLGVFSLSDQGKTFWLFFKGVKAEFGKIFFPKSNEILNGLFVVLLFSLVLMVIIGAMDHVFLNLYNSLM